jgi:hypothetical protein
MPRLFHKAVTPGQQRKGVRARRRYASDLYDAEVRAYITRRLSQNVSVPTVAKELALPKRLIEEYMDQSLDKIKALGPAAIRRGEERFPSDVIPPKGYSQPGVGPGPHVKGSSRVPPPKVFDGEVLDPPDEAAFKKRAYELRKRAIPFDEIASILGRSEQECRKAVRSRLQAMETDELADMTLARRMMLEQIDAMIQAITVPATGRDIDGAPTKVVLQAIDRMVKLLDQKAHLLGLNAPQRIDITHRLQSLADQSGYDIEDLRAIATDVIKSYTARSLS